MQPVIAAINAWHSIFGSEMSDKSPSRQDCINGSFAGNTFLGHIYVFHLEAQQA